ncbi:MAG: FecR domain-containing protein [Chitinispirillaceae bacterium]|nr:FecR domain-containing protein [Chitinispirillaceae bacterium]
MKSILLITVVVCGGITVSAQPAAKVTRIEGSAQVLKNGTASWKVARLNMALQVNDQLKSDAESLVEITFRQGAIMRLAENSLCSIKKSDDAASSTTVPRGKVWINMQKLSSSGHDFDIATPTAVAAIRGTVFQMQSLPDLSADVAVFDGKVAVGLSDEGKKRVHLPDNKITQAPHEVPGPTEVPGPYEVTLDQWRTIIAGQRISIRSDGTYATTDFDLNKQLDAFIEKNRSLDAQIKEAR